MATAVSPDETKVLFTNEQLGSVRVTKTFVFPEGSGLAVPDGFKITAEIGDDAIELTTSGTQAGNVTLTGSGTGPFIWIISDLPVGISATFTEKDYAAAGFITISTVSVNDGTSASGTSGTATTSVTPNTVAFRNEYREGTALPTTGGPGTVLYTAVGLSLLLGAGLWLVLCRRKERQY